MSKLAPQPLSSSLTVDEHETLNAESSTGARSEGFPSCVGVWRGGPIDPHFRPYHYPGPGTVQVGCPGPLANNRTGMLGPVTQCRNDFAALIAVIVIWSTDETAPSGYSVERFEDEHGHGHQPGGDHAGNGAQPGRHSKFGIDTCRVAVLISSVGPR
jgi:hypothetical protein